MPPPRVVVTVVLPNLLRVVIREPDFVMRTVVLPINPPTEKPNDVIEKWYALTRAALLGR